ncbi:hypothetical protein CSC73_06050 [Pseudoxanthomonas sacheonensis]|nr:hypothetical protein CSC73_06050 [Pseudoxanthomonas sacheonensis]
MTVVRQGRNAAEFDGEYRWINRLPFQLRKPSFGDCARLRREGAIARQEVIAKDGDIFALPLTTLLSGVALLRFQ